MNTLHHSFIEAERPSVLPSLATTPEIDRALQTGSLPPLLPEGEE